MVVTRLTRNQLAGNTARGFESLHLRQKRQDTFWYLVFFIVSMGFEPEGTGKAAGGSFQPEVACTEVQVESLHLRHVKITPRVICRRRRLGGAKPRPRTGWGLPCGEPPFCFLSAENKTFAPTQLWVLRALRGKKKIQRFRLEKF